MTMLVPVGILLMASVILLVVLQPPAHPSTDGAAVVLLLDQDPPQVRFQTSSGPMTFDVEIADEPEEWQTGLMFREALPADAGMLFIFPDERVRRFWMKNTLIPLDMVFLSAGLEIVHIEENVPVCDADPCPLYSSIRPAQYVLEINAGQRNRVGL